MDKVTKTGASADGSVDEFTDKPMKTQHFFGDAMTVVSTNIIFNIVTTITYFYTDIIGMAATTVGLVLLLSKFFDAFSDIGMGIILDRTKSKYGKARPWLIRMALPSLICIVILFTIPSDAGEGGKTAYATITNLLVLSVVYTAISVPSGSLLSLATKNPHERAKMGIWRIIFAYAAGMGVSSLMLPAANRLGGGQTAWIITSLVYGLISAGSLVVAFFCVRENHSVPLQKENRVSLLKGVSLLLKNKYWILVLAVNVLVQMIYAMNVASIYYAKYILGDENLVGLMGLVSLGFIILGIALSGLSVRRLGKRNLVLIGTAVSVLGCVLRAINPYHLVLNLIAIGITNLGSVSVLAMAGAMVADTIEYGEWKTGVRSVGLASSAHSFAGKLGAALFAGVAGGLLGLSGYDGMLSVQPPMATRMILILNIYIPLICYGLIFVLMLFYRLDTEYGRIVAELDARRENG